MGAFRYWKILCVVMVFLGTAIIRCTIEDLVEEAVHSIHSITREKRQKRLLLYHAIGNTIVEENFPKEIQHYFVDRLSRELCSRVGKPKYFTRKNLYYMRSLASQYDCKELADSALCGLPWDHVVLLIYAVSDKKRRESLALAANAAGWSLTQLWEKINENPDEPALRERPRKKKRDLQCCEEETSAEPHNT